MGLCTARSPPTSDAASSSPSYSSVIWLAIGAVCGLLARDLSATTHLDSGTRRRGGLCCPGHLRDRLLAQRRKGAFASPEPCRPTRSATIHNLVEALAIGEGIPKPAVYVIDDPSPNAFATGVSPDEAAITVTTGLVSIMNREELEGVIGHEMSHIKNYDVRLLLMRRPWSAWRVCWPAWCGEGRSSPEAAEAASRATRSCSWSSPPPRCSQSSASSLVRSRLALSRRRRGAGRRQRRGADSQSGGADERVLRTAAERPAVQVQPRDRRYVHRRPAAAPRRLVPHPHRPTPRSRSGSRPREIPRGPDRRPPGGEQARISAR